jgi:hypothetical protein
MRDNYGFLGSASVIRVLPRQHIHLPLILAQLAQISLKEEDIGALHGRVEELRDGNRIVRIISTTHDGTASLDSVHGVLASDIQHSQPVVVGTFVDLI